jgi:oligoendopeptidase F
MVANAVERTTGAENVIWDLSVFYKGIDDPNIQRDMDALTKRVEKFASEYKGRVANLDAEEMMDAMTELEGIYDAGGRIGHFASLLYATDTNNPQYGALMQKFTEYDSKIDQQLVFFELEWNQGDDAAAQKLLSDPTIAKYRHKLEADRRYKPYQLSEIEEQMLSEKSVTGRSAWTRFFSQVIGALRLDYDGQKLP